MHSDKIKKGIKTNKLLRYQAIKEEYNAHRRLGIPTAVIWREHIYPKYFISRTTLYNILCTSVNKELQEMHNEQLSMF